MKSFIEFGASIKPNLSNLLLDGWHGILVEPHPFSLVTLVAYLDKLNDISYDLYAGIVTPREGEIVVYKSGSVNFSELGYKAETGGARSSTWNAGHWKEHKGPGLKYVSITLDRLVAEAPFPVERFEIDCEGMEVDIFESYSWIQRPGYIKVAPHGVSIIDRLVSVICGQGYELVGSHEDLCFKKNEI